MKKNRLDHEMPPAVEQWGWKFHHLGIPTEEKRPGERYIPHLKFYVSGFPVSPFGIEWMRFEEDCMLDELIRRVPHLAFVVEDLDYELENRGLKLLSPPGVPSEGVRVAMIEWEGAPVELMEFSKA